MEPYFETMAGARATAWGPDVQAPALGANATLPGIEVFVDLAGLIDLDAEIAKKRDELAKLEARIAAQQKKLANENFLRRAPAAVVEKERGQLGSLLEQQAVLLRTIAALESAFRKGRREEHE
jgi:valyl-tRNA synthetase